MEYLNFRTDKRIRSTANTDFIVVLGIDDFHDRSRNFDKLRGYIIDILYVPKQFEEVFELTQTYSYISQCLIDASEIRFF